MTAQLIDGKVIAQKVRDEVAAQVAKRTAAGKPNPPWQRCWSVTGRIRLPMWPPREKPARNWEWVPSASTCLRMPPRSRWRELVRKLNADKEVNGILVQLPMPAHIDEERVLSLISIEKDVDGFSPLNIGRLAQKGRNPLFVPCTPYGCIYLLEQAGVKIEGANAVVLGRSNIVGMPAALLLVSRNATVTVCHSRTRDLAGNGPPGRYPDRCHRQDGDGARRLDQARRSGHRRGHELRTGCHQEERSPPGGRREFRGSQRSGRIYYPRPGRRGPDDDRHADEKHLARLGNPEPVKKKYRNWG